MNWRTWSLRKAGVLVLAFVLVSTFLRLLVHALTDSIWVPLVVDTVCILVVFPLLAAFVAAAMRAGRDDDRK